MGLVGKAPGSYLPNASPTPGTAQGGEIALTLVFERPNFRYPFKEIRLYYFILMVFIGCLVYTRCFRTLTLPLPHLNLYSCYTVLQMRKLRLGKVKQFAYITTVKRGVMVLLARG